MTNEDNSGPAIWNTLINNEELLSVLYKKYSEVFTDDSDFWMEISDDETVHAGWLRDLSDEVSTGELYISNERFTNETYTKFGEYINENIENAGKDEKTSIDALTIAMNIENSMLEVALFKIYDTDDIRLKNVMDKLRKSTEIHCAEINKRREEELQKTL